MTKRNVTPKDVKKLEPNEVFVFGSNLAGNHVGGAAKTARKLFGAKNGVGSGITGKCYAFPTLNADLSRRSMEELKASADAFIKYAKDHPRKTFLLSRVGCGIAGYDEEEMKSLFYGSPANAVKPEGWNKTLWKFLRSGFVSENGDKCKWKTGAWKKETDINICHKGFHASTRIIDAFSYVRGETLAQVEVRGKNIIQKDKECWEEMRVIKTLKWTKEESVRLAIFAAEQVIDIFEKRYPKDDRPRKAIEAAKVYLKNPTYAAYAADAAARATDAAYAADAAARATDVLGKIEEYLFKRVDDLKIVKSQH